VFIALGVVEQNPRRKAENADDFHEREAAAWLLFGELRVGPLVFGRIGHTHPGAVEHPHAPAIPEFLGFAGVSGDGTAQAGQDGSREANKRSKWIRL
jgi:hypothetical protein